MPRKYADQTLKILFGLSRNQCAHPECTTALITRPDRNYTSHIVANICHIYSYRSAGPRGNSGLTPDQLNSVENLVLLCRNHHGLIDDQPENYPPELLQQWKRDHEESTHLQPERQHGILGLRFPTELVDQAVEKQVATLCQSRFFRQFDATRYAAISRW